MTYLGNKDYKLEVQKGNVAGTSILIVRGHNPSIAAAAGTIELNEFGNLTRLTSASVISVNSTSSADIDSSGVGMRTLTISGVLANSDLVTETIVLNGVTPVNTAASFLRVNSMVGLTAGTTGWNVGNIIARAVTGNTIQCECDATEGASQNGMYYVPTGKTMYPFQAEFNCNRVAGGTSPNVEFKLYARPSASACWLQLYDKSVDTDVSTEIDVIVPRTPLVGGAEVYFAADTDQNSTDVRVRMMAFLVE